MHYLLTITPQKSPILWFRVNSTLFVWSVLLSVELLFTAAPLDRLEGTSAYLAWYFATTLVWFGEVGLKCYSRWLDAASPNCLSANKAGCRNLSRIDIGGLLLDWFCESILVLAKSWQRYKWGGFRRDPEQSSIFIWNVNISAFARTKWLHWCFWPPTNWQSIHST